MSSPIPSSDNRYLEFLVGQSRYCLPLLKVREVMGVPEITSIPNTPAYFAGIMNLRGLIVSVLDLRKKLATAAKKSADSEEAEAVIVVDLGTVYVGALVDSVTRVLNLKTDQMKPPPEFNDARRMKFVKGVCEVDSQLSLVVDIGEMLDLKDLETIQNQRKVS